MLKYTTLFKIKEVKLKEIYLIDLLKIFKGRKEITMKTTKDQYYIIEKIVDLIPTRLIPISLFIAIISCIILRIKIDIMPSEFASTLGLFFTGLSVILLVVGITLKGFIQIEKNQKEIIYLKEEVEKLKKGDRIRGE